MADGSGRRVLPHNVDAEEAVIGGLLFPGGSTRLPEVAELLVPGDFYHPALRVVYEAHCAENRATGRAQVHGGSALGADELRAEC